MKQDTDWHATNTSYTPLTLLKLIEKITLAHTEYHYTFSTFYDQEIIFHIFYQGSMSKSQ